MTQQNDGRSIETLGELKQAFQDLPDDTKVSMSAAAAPGLSFQHTDSGVILGARSAPNEGKSAG